MTTLAEIRRLLYVQQRPAPNFNSLSEECRFFYTEFEGLYQQLKSESNYTEEQISEKQDSRHDNLFHDFAEGYFHWGVTWDATLLLLAEKLYALWYEKTREKERNENIRLHKGTQLHQLGWLNEKKDNLDKAYDYYFMGWIEDVLSNRSYDQTQGFRQLNYFLGIPKEVLRDISIFIHKQTDNSPESLLKKIKQKYIIPTPSEVQDFNAEKIKEIMNKWQEIKQIWNTEGEANATRTSPGSEFEDFIEDFFSSISGLIPRGKRRSALTSAAARQHDYDLILFNNSKSLGYLDSYIIVECKFWSAEVDYHEIAKFFHKLHLRKIKTGFIVSMEGVIGRKYNETIREIYTSDGITILNFDLGDIEEVINKQINLISLIRTKYEQVRFKLS